MSIESMCSKDRIEIRREVVTRSSGGEATKTWTVEAREDLPALDVKCRRQAMKAEEAIAAGVSSGLRAWKLYFFFDPSLDKRDRIYFTDGFEIECEVSTPSEQDDSQDRLWHAVVVRFGPGKR